jgi:hypothetical protein
MADSLVNRWLFVEKAKLNVGTMKLFEFIIYEVEGSITPGSQIRFSHSNIYRVE